MRPGPRRNERGALTRLPERAQNLLAYLDWIVNAGARYFDYSLSNDLCKWIRAIRDFQVTE
jgi:hypothetical protein